MLVFIFIANKLEFRFVETKFHFVFHFPFSSAYAECIFIKISRIRNIFQRVRFAIGKINKNIYKKKKKYEMHVEHMRYLHIFVYSYIHTLYNGSCRLQLISVHISI